MSDDGSKFQDSRQRQSGKFETEKMDSAPPQTSGGPTSVRQLPPEAIALAGRMFDAARNGDEQSVALLTQALERGLPANLTNDKGDTLVSHHTLSEICQKEHLSIRNFLQCDHDHDYHGVPRAAPD